MGFFSFDSVWNFLPAFVNKSEPNSHGFWDKSGQREQRGSNTQNKNFLNLSLICVMFFRWIPLKNVCLEHGNIFIAALTVVVIGKDQQSYFTVAVIWKDQQSYFTVVVIWKDQQSYFTVAVIWKDQQSYFTVAVK